MLPPPPPFASPVPLRTQEARARTCAHLCSCVVVSPEWSDLVLASYVPYVELYVAVGDRLDVEPDRRDRRHRLVQLQLVQNGYRTEGEVRRRQYETMVQLLMPLGAGERSGRPNSSSSPGGHE